MANAKRDTTTILEELGGKRVLPRSTKLGKRYKHGGDNQEAKFVLVAVLDMDFGHCLKEVYCDGVLEELMGAPGYYPNIWPTYYYELPEGAVERLNSHPRIAELVS